MAAGTASRFVPLSAEVPKGLLMVNGEIVIERQIRQLREAGVEDITVVVGYKSEMFEYLRDKFGVSIVLNEDYARYNNTSSIVRVVDRLADTYICSSDNYFPENVFLGYPIQSYYSSLYAPGRTGEYCLSINENDEIIGVSVGGEGSWYMVGHVYFSREFSLAFRELLLSEYDKDETRQGYWEDLYIKHLLELPKMKIHRYLENEIIEFDTLDELRQFDNSYWDDTHSSILKSICKRLDCCERDLSCFTKVKHDGDCVMFDFNRGNARLRYDGQHDTIELI